MVSPTETIALFAILAAAFVTHLVLPLRWMGIVGTQYIRKRSILSALFSKQALGVYLLTIVLSSAVEFAAIYLFKDKMREADSQTS